MSSKSGWTMVLVDGPIAPIFALYPRWSMFASSLQQFEKFITSMDVRIFLLHVEQIGLMGLIGSVTDTVFDHYRAKVPLHGVDYRCAHAAAGGTPRNRNGVDVAK